MLGLKSQSGASDVNMLHSSLEIIPQKVGFIQNVNMTNTSKYRPMRCTNMTCLLLNINISLEDIISPSIYLYKNKNKSVFSSGLQYLVYRGFKDIHPCV